jgi:peptide deformylase
MALRKIAVLGEPVLRQPARELTRDELLSERWQQFIDDLIETMRDADGAGIAAPQVFEPVRIAVMEVKGNNPRYPYKPPIPLTVMVNPVITPIGDETFDNYEGCLSVPDLRGVVKRHARVRVRYLDRHGEPHDVETAGLTAGTYQHECDHLDGKVFVDRVTDPTTLCTWKNWERHRKPAFVDYITGIVKKYGA